MNLSDLDVHLRSHVIHRKEFLQLVQEFQQLRQQVPRLLAQEFQLLEQVVQQLQLVQAHRQQELVRQLQRLLLLSRQQLFSRVLFSRQLS